MTLDDIQYSETVEWGAGEYRGGICRMYHDNTLIAYNMLRLIGEHTHDKYFLRVLFTNDRFQDGRGWSYTIPKRCKPETASLLEKWGDIWDEKIERTERRGWELLKNADSLEEFERVLDMEEAYKEDVEEQEEELQF
jgi:hypothetical protein